MIHQKREYSLVERGTYIGKETKEHRTGSGEKIESNEKEKHTHSLHCKEKPAKKGFR